jgi:acyl carrier protein
MSITTDETRDLVRGALGHLVPASEIDALAPDDDIRQTLELDSLDFVEFVERLSQGSGVRIDEEDYPELRTLATLSAFLDARR